MKRIACLLLALLLTAGCAANRTGTGRYEQTYLDLFDTVTTVVGYADSEEEFRETAQTVHDRLQTYHRLFDIYEDYPGVVNLKTVNERAGREPVTVDREIMALLLFCKEMAGATQGRVNAAMGSVLSLWHEARTAGLDSPETAALPDPAALRAAAAHTNPDDVLLDEAACTVQFADPALQLDVGAVAKGFAVEQVCRDLPEGYLINVGGNVCATGPKPDGSSWLVGLQDPDGQGSLRTIRADRCAVVTSGDYQRYYTVDGVRYHHIIDPETGMPGTKWRAVSVICADSAVADALSTALFLLDRQQGEAVLRAYEAEAMWIDGAGNVSCTEGFSRFAAE